MTRLPSTYICSHSTHTCPLIRVINITQECSDPIPGASVFSCTKISALNVCFLLLLGTWLLKKQHSNHWFILQREWDWVGERRGMGLSVCLCDLVLSCLQHLLVQRDLNAYCNRQILRKAASIPACLGRVLAVEFSLLPSGRRYALPACKTNCHSKSFIPSAVRFLNSL